LGGTNDPNRTKTPEWSKNDPKPDQPAQKRIARPRNGSKPAQTRIKTGRKPDNKLNKKFPGRVDFSHAV
jgi:hypothetical protein